MLSRHPLTDCVPRSIKNIAVVVAGLLLLLTSSCTNSLTIQPPTKLTQSVPEQPPQSPVPSPPDTINIKGTAYHDYNGNAVKDEDEPGIAGIKLSIINERDNKVTDVKTNIDGTYGIQLLKDKYKLSIGENILGHNKQPFRYLSISKETFQSVDTPLYLEVKGNMTYDIKLMQGFLTLPFHKGIDHHVSYYYDIDPRYGYLGSWNSIERTYDQHTGTDFDLPLDTAVLAAAPGTVIFIGWDEYGLGGNQIMIEHKDKGITGYAHLRRIDVNVGDNIERGKQIGLSGDTSRAAISPHLHFDFAMSDNRHLDLRRDIYRDINNPSSVSQWTVDNYPQHP
jgi:murein DD-endopeptidase MepM/ murein hydrolase activator NlpD